MRKLSNFVFISLHSIDFLSKLIFDVDKIINNNEARFIIRSAKRLEAEFNNLDKKIDSKKISNFYKFIERRSSKEPIAYILKKKEFWSKSFLVDYNTLIRIDHCAKL